MNHRKTGSDWVTEQSLVALRCQYILQENSDYLPNERKLYDSTKRGCESGNGVCKLKTYLRHPTLSIVVVVVLFGGITYVCLQRSLLFTTNLV